MSIKIKRVQSLESGDFNPTGGRTRAHIEVPASVGFTDPHNSHLVFRMSAYCTANGAYSRLVPTCLGNVVNAQVTTSAGGAQVLIRNARVTSKEYGMLNEQRDQNVVNANLGEYLHSTSGKRAEASYTGDGDYETSLEHEVKLVHSPFMTYSRPYDFGTTITKTSENRYTEVRVPMKHIDRFADGIRQFPNLAVGDLTYRVELDDIHDLAGIPNQNEPVPLINRAAVASQIGSAAAPLLFKPRNGAVDFDLNNINEIPFYVGMPVTLTYSDSASPPAKTHTSNIGSLKLDAATRQLEIVLDTPAATAGATDAVTNMTLTLYVDAAATFTWNIEDIFLELHCLQLTPAQLETARKAMSNLQIPWYEHRLVKKVLNQTADYSEVLQLDPLCAGLAVMTPIQGRLVSGRDSATSYRFAIDGKNTTNRDVTVGVRNNGTGTGARLCLHDHLLQKWFGNLGYRLLKFDRPAINYAFGANEDTHFFYPLVTPKVGRDLLVNFNVRASANMNTKEVYYLTVHERALQFKDGRLQ